MAGLYQVGLGQGDQPAAYAEQPADIEMFPCLRHDRFVRCDNQQNRLDTSRACEHVLDEAFVAWYIHKADTVAAGKRKVREAEINRNAARLLFR